MNIPIKASAAFVAMCAMAQAQSPASLTWASGTFPAPIYQKWVESFEAHSPGLPITYRALGSEKSIEELRNGAVDFAASDLPLNAQTQSQLGVRLIPILVGAVVPVYNLPDVFAQLRFTPHLLADIYLGKITKWDDPQIKALNKEAHLPAEDIVVVHRSEASGTTYLWTEFLSQSSGNWKAKLAQTPGRGGRSDKEKWGTRESRSLSRINRFLSAMSSSFTPSKAT